MFPSSLPVRSAEFCWSDLRQVTSHWTINHQRHYRNRTSNRMHILWFPRIVSVYHKRRSFSQFVRASTSRRESNAAGNEKPVLRPHTYTQKHSVGIEASLESPTLIAQIQPQYFLQFEAPKKLGRLCFLCQTWKRRKKEKKIKKGKKLLHYLVLSESRGMFHAALVAAVHHGILYKRCAPPKLNRRLVRIYCFCPST